MDFSRFSSQAFEQLVQALSVSVLGPSVVVFGRGPDGAREATFEGKVPGFEALDWVGYLVVQAKCKQTLFGDHRDALWLVEQLRSELEKFSKNPNLRRPEYYLLCSNVELSSVPVSGGKAKVDAVFREYQSSLGFKGWHVWSATELQSLLEGAEDVRRAYSAWVTPSDVLSELLKKVAGPDLFELLPLSLAQSIREERDVRLREAGQDTEQPIYLERVFVDLPVDTADDRVGDTTDSDLVDLMTDDASSDDSPGRPVISNGCMAELVRRAGERLRVDRVIRRSKRQPHRNRVVILGGPGQGKSTIGQFLAQFLRARALSSIRNRLTPETLESIDQILSAGKDMGIVLGDGPIRIPFRVDLPRFADESSKNSKTKILQYIAAQISAQVDEHVESGGLRSLLGMAPWCVIFDGLDEVPPSANRQQILEAINGFWDEVHLVGGDVLALVTTRPQGYSNDFDPHVWDHWTLSPLSPAKALAYSERLADVRILDRDRRRLIIADIASVANDPATEPLVATPLQVAILFGISLLKGAIPQDRWELFDRYYSLLRDREAQKPGITGAFIRDYKRIIDELHQVCGFLLQVEAERSGGTESYLSNDQLRGIIGELLEAEGYSQSERSVLIGEISRIATQRLVLLATRVEGRISFDVRALQEYMAAAKIVGSDQAQFDARMRTIAVSAHWRNVWRIAASKVFSVVELGHLRSVIVAICDALDKGDIEPDAARVKAGAELALDLFVDGVAARAPKFQRQFAVRAIDLVDLGINGFDPRLASVGRGETSGLLAEAIRERVQRGGRSQAKAAWRLLMRLIGDEPWATSIMTSILPADPEYLLDLFAGALTRRLPPSVVPLLTAAQRKVGPTVSQDFVSLLGRTVREGEDDIRSQAVFLFDIRIPEQVETAFAEWSFGAFSTFSPLEGLKSVWSSVPKDLDARVWGRTAAACRFFDDPSVSGLASAFEHVSASREKDAMPEVPSDELMPWPLLAAIRDWTDGGRRHLILRRIIQGKYGNPESWKSAELRWIGRGLAMDDLKVWKSGYSIDENIAEVGAPPSSLLWRTRQSIDPSDVRSLLGLALSLPAGRKRDRLLRLTILSARRSANSDLQIEIKNAVLAIALGKADDAPILRSAIGMGDVLWEDDRVVIIADEIGRGRSIALPGVSNKAITDAIVAHPECRGLLVLLARGIRLHRSADYFDVSILPLSAFATSADDTASIKAAVAMLRVFADRWEINEAPMMARDLVNTSALVRSALEYLSTRLPSRDHRRRAMIRAIVAAQDPLESGWQSLFDAMSAIVNSSETDLAQPAIARSLGLPHLA